MIQTWRFPRAVLWRRAETEKRLIEQGKLRREAARDE